MGQGAGARRRGFFHGANNMPVPARGRRARGGCVGSDLVSPGLRRPLLHYSPPEGRPRRERRTPARGRRTAASSPNVAPPGLARRGRALYDPLTPETAIDGGTEA